MLEQLFGSRTRVKLLRLFLHDPERRFYVRELTRVVDEHLNSVRRELLHLEQAGLILTYEEDRKKYYRVNTAWVLYPELRSLMIKSQLAGTEELMEKLKQLGDIRKLVLSGCFVEGSSAPTDILIVGSVDTRELKSVLDDFQKGFDREIYYTLLTPEEFAWRQEIGDRFLFEMFQSKHLVLVDRLLEPVQTQKNLS